MWSWAWKRLRTPGIRYVEPSESDTTLLVGQDDYQVGFEVLTAMSTKLAVFWVVAPGRRVIIRAMSHPDDGSSKDL
jgi:hypothetical protein